MDDKPGRRGVKSVVLNESDRELVSMAARLLMAQEPGQSRVDAAEQLTQDYRDDLTDAHLGVDPEVLEEMALDFSGALLLEMERLTEVDEKGGAEAEAEAKPIGGASLPYRHRVIATLGRLLKAVDLRH